MRTLVGVRTDFLPTQFTCCLYQFTRMLNDGLKDIGRQQVVQLMWEIAYVGGRLNGFEANRTADLLGVSSRQRVGIRRQIAETSASASGWAENMASHACAWRR
jgi:Tellurite resistance protein TerB